MNEKIEYNQKVVAKPGDLLGLLFWTLCLVPKNFLSWLVGAVARMELPHPFSLWINQAFIKVFGIDMEEAEHEVRAYTSVEDVFTRKLKADVRPIVGPICSPADGFLALSKKANAEMAVQVKGMTYNLAELVLGEMAEPPAGVMQLGWFTTVYLAPHNYHRVHSPVAGKLTKIRYLPGELWPVNGPAVKRIPRLFNRNERLVFDIEADSGGKVYVVMVGALNVGRIVTPHWDVVTNAFSRQLGARPAIKKFEAKKDILIGEELGTFQLGSTVVIVYDDEFLQHNTVKAAEGNRPILMGQTLAGES